MQRNLFDLPSEPGDLPDIPGLSYLPEYIDRKHGKRLLSLIDKNEWSSELSRRVQHYGYRYNYSRPHELEYLGKLPRWAMDLAKSFQENNIVSELPDQVIVNEYEPGQGIAPHVDLVRQFKDTILSLSLGSPCVMDFIKDETREKLSMLLQPRSLLVMQGDARYKWKHCIAKRKVDNFHGQHIPRERRVSLTFRKVTQ